VCTDDGIIYDIVAVVPYVRKFGRHPVKGTPLALGDLIHLNFHKNAGEPHGLLGLGRLLRLVICTVGQAGGRGPLLVRTKPACCAVPGQRNRLLVDGVCACRVLACERLLGGGFAV
jgi:hypothetical protein